MKASIYSLFVMSIMVLFLGSCKNEEYPKNPDGELTWITIDQAAELQNKDQKFYFVDVYTEWCGWCKKMDKSTFQDTEVIKYLDENYHVVKFDAEDKRAITWQDSEYLYKPGGRRGVNMLARELLNGRLSYPSFAVLDENRNPLKVIIGYKTPEQLLEDLKPLRTNS